MSGQTTGRKGRKSRQNPEAERDGLTGEQRPTLVRQISLALDEFVDRRTREINSRKINSGK